LIVSAEPYVTVTLRKDMVKRLSKLNPKRPTSALVAEAILEYINNKTYELKNKTSDMHFFKFSGTYSTTTPEVSNPAEHLV
jgi:hypothetical protein